MFSLVFLLAPFYFSLKYCAWEEFTKLIFLYKQLKLSFYKVIIALTVAYAFPALVILKDKALTVAQLGSRYKFIKMEGYIRPGKYFECSEIISFYQLSCAFCSPNQFLDLSTSLIVANYLKFPSSNVSVLMFVTSYFFGLPAGYQYCLGWFYHFIWIRDIQIVFPVSVIVYAMYPSDLLLKS